MLTLVSSSRIPVGSHDHTESCAQRERSSGPLVSAENHVYLIRAAAPGHQQVAYWTLFHPRTELPGCILTKN